MKKTISSLVILLLIGIFFYSQELVVSPTRKPLESYHLARLNNPQNYNMSIQRYLSSKEHIPYLFVRFDERKLSEKAKKVRQEVREMGFEGVYELREATIVMLHGKNGRKEDLLPIAQRYTALGFDCILIDIPAHGQSPLKRLYYGTKEHERVYVDSVLDDLSKYHHIDRDKLFLWGYSLGGAFAVRTAHHSKYSFKGMVLVSTFDTLDGVLEDKTKAIFGNSQGRNIYGFLRWSLRNFYDLNTLQASSVELAKNITLPLFMAHGKHDALIDIKRGEKLFSAFASEPKYLNEDTQADHQNIFITKENFYAKSGWFLMKILLMRA